jgi:hypothetical protein
LSKAENAVKKDLQKREQEMKKCVLILKIYLYNINMKKFAQFVKLFYIWIKANNIEITFNA